MKLRIALAQMRSEKGDWEGNLKRAERYMAQAAAENCHIIVLPEMSLSGYADPAKFPHAVQTLDSPWIEQFIALTKRHAIAASGGFIEANPGGKPYITQLLAQGGRLTGVYRKVHIVDEEADWFSPGSDMPVFTLTLQEKELTCALAVCADDDRPDLFSTFARQGARVIFHSSAPGLYGRRKSEAEWQDGYDWYTDHLAERLPHYARRNRLYIAVATQTGATVDEDFPGGSFVFGPDGECLAGTPNWDEALLIHEIDFTPD
jgi:predicted amidohydrolase